MSTLSFAYGDGFTGIRNDAEPSAVYVRGDEFTDGSLRVIPVERGQSGRFDLEVRERENGVWNSTGLKVSGQSLHLGSNLDVSAAGGLLRTLEALSQDDGLLPVTEFDIAGGTGRTLAAVVDERIVGLVIQPDATFEVSGSQLTSTFTSPVPLILSSPPRVLISRIYHSTGSVAITEPVRYIIRKESPAGEIIFDQMLPTSMVGTPDTEFGIEVFGMLEVGVGDLLFASMSSEDEEEGSVCLKADAGGEWFLALDVHPLEREEVLLDNMVLAADTGLVFDNAAGFVTRRAF